MFIHSRSHPFASNVRRVVIPVTGFSAKGAPVGHLESAIGKLIGVQTVFVNPSLEMVYVAFDALKTTAEQVREVIMGLGFEVGQTGHR